jgi:hypothetical protein
MARQAVEEHGTIAMNAQEDARRARLAAALRDNLKRRKVQARAQVTRHVVVDGLVNVRGDIDAPDGVSKEPLGTSDQQPIETSSPVQKLR